MRRRLLFLGLLPLLATGSAWLMFRPVHGQPPPAAPAAPAFAGEPPAPSLSVDVVVLQGTRFHESINATGTLRADEAVELQAETSGKIVAIHFREGTPVQRGDLLVKINDADLQASRQRAAARRALAENRERRLAQLLREGGANQQDYDAALSELQVQTAELQLIDAQIAKTEIRAPFDGIVGLRAVSEGTYVAPTTRIATLQKLDTLKVDFAIPEKYGLRVHPGQELTFAIAGDPGRFGAQVYAVEPRVDEATRTLLLRARAENPQGRLRPGAFANVEFVLRNESNALLVPATAVVPGLAAKNVYVVENGRAVRRDVQLGARTESEVEITAGLQPGDAVITSGVHVLRPGLMVAARQPAPADLTDSRSP